VQIGLTGVRELTRWPQAMRACSESWRQGKITLRVSMQLDLPFADRTVEDLTKWGVGPGFGDHWLRLDSIDEEPYVPKTPAKIIHRYRDCGQPAGLAARASCQRQSGHEFQRRRGFE